MLSMLGEVCKRLVGRDWDDPAARPVAEEASAPVSLLEDDTSLLAWRQEVYVQSRLQDFPQLTVGEARVRPCAFEALRLQEFSFG